MTILQGDIQLRASQVMLDVSNGGGAPTSTQIVDGQNNGIFPDVSEVDRAGGNLSARKVFVKVLTNNTDSYLGSNVIVEEPPSDPRVSVTLFSTGETFDTRADAMNRIEAYLFVGSALSFYLLGDHIAGQMTLTMLGQVNAVPPVVGQTLVLRKLPGQAGQHEQYVRVTDVSTVVRTFTDDSGDFTRLQVTLGLSDQLDADYPGFDPTRRDATLSYATKTKVYDTIVADAARYYGTSALKVPASIGDYTILAESIYSALVPSAQIETPIADARMNQQLSALVESGSATTLSLTLAFTTSANLYVGGSIEPGSLSVSRGGVTLQDKGGTLVDAATTNQVGLVDYANGVLSLTTNVWGTASGTHVVGYKPAATPVIVSQSFSWTVTQASQRLSYVATLDPIPARASLQLSYLSGGHWYTISDDGSGALRGSDSSFGVGTLNFSTGTLSATLGALPDVGSEVIVVWAPTAQAPKLSTVPTSGHALDSRAFFAFQLSQPFAPGSLTLAWAGKTATDDGAGGLTGDAQGELIYGNGIIRVSPNALPDALTNLTISVTPATALSGAVPAFTDSGSTWSATLGAGLRPHSVQIAVVGQRPLRQFPGIDATTPLALRVFDDGAGNLQLATPSGNLTVGSVNYSTGAIGLSKSLPTWQEVQPTYDDLTPFGTPGTDPAYVQYTGTEIRTVTLTVLNGGTVDVPAWAWWSGGLTTAAQWQASGSDGTGSSVVVPLQTLYVRGGASTWFIGSDRYVTVGSTDVQRNPSPSTGAGTAAGSQGHAYSALVGQSYVESGFDQILVASYSSLTLWTAGYAPTILNAAGTVSPALTGASGQLVDVAIIRTAVSPLRNGGFQIAGTWADGTTFTATADAAGIVKSGSAPVGTAGVGGRGVFGTVNYDTGIARLRFGRWVGSDHAADTGVTDVSYLGIAGVQYLRSEGAQADTLRYNASAYTYLPLDPDIIGVNPVRLPSDGRVPIIRKGGYAVVGHKGIVGPVTVTAGQVLNCGRTRLARARILGSDGAAIATGYTADLDAGLVTINDPTGWAQPIKLEHKIEDMALVRDAQISGQITFTRPLTHDFPIGSYVSSALMAGTLQARVSVLFDQASFTTPWSDVVSGAEATATFNAIDHPISVTNGGAVTERWAIRFTNTNAFDVIGEHLGVIASGNTSTDCAPINTASGTGLPYFVLPAAGWGGGWSVGNVLRFNTVGAEIPVWVIRTVQQGPATADADKFTLLPRGDINKD